MGVGEIIWVFFMLSALLPISTDMPEEVYEFMSLFPQPTRTRPSVEYVPMPYRGNQDTSGS